MVHEDRPLRHGDVGVYATRAQLCSALDEGTLGGHQGPLEPNLTRLCHKAPAMPCCMRAATQALMTSTAIVEKGIFSAHRLEW
jgi:hypothetical protein